MYMAIHQQSQNELSSGLKDRIGYPITKLVIEWVSALLLLVVAAPVIAIVALIVRITSPGPVIYRQMRLGRGGRPYLMYKLRTMEQDCEAKTGAVWASKDDPRVTPLGRWLRQTHLDELPQLWNVLRGEMSLIGPRPERPEIASRISQSLQEYEDRLVVRPGLTGLAQVQLPPDQDIDSVRQKLAQDLFYVKNMGFMLDLRIALATAFLFLQALAQSMTHVLMLGYGQAAIEISVAGCEQDQEAPIFEAEGTLGMAARRAA